MTQTTSASDILTPVQDEDGTPFWQYTAEGELRIQTCTTPTCKTLRFPPRPCCPHCQSFETEWRRMSGRGRIWSFVIPHPPLLPWYAEQAPYNAVLVELAEAPHIRLAGNLVTGPDAPLNSLSPEKLRIGAPVKVTFSPLPDGTRLPRWLLERP